jgi:hypothetical protein
MPSAREIVPLRELPDDVWLLLQDRITGLDELKALLLASGDPSKSWTVSAIGKHLGTRTPWTETVLEKLCAAALLVTEGEGPARRFSYRPQTPDLAAAVSTLATIYDDNRTKIVSILSHNAMTRIRQSAFHTFAGAWMTKRDEEDEDG